MEGWVEQFLGAAWATRGTALRLLLAGALGSLIGLERERSGKPAGFRTHLLICVGAALLTEVSIEVARDVDLPGGWRADPGRIAAQIVTGVGFIGAGTILQARASVIGLTTAASLWVVAAIGITVGAGMYLAAGFATVLVVVALMVLGRIERGMRDTGPVEHTIEIELEPDSPAFPELEMLLERAGLTVVRVRVRRDAGLLIATYRTVGAERHRHDAVRDLVGRPGVIGVSVE